MNDKFNDTIIGFVVGLLFFISFAYDMEYDRDFMTWMWLLASVLFFVISYNNYKEWKRIKKTKL